MEWIIFYIAVGMGNLVAELVIGYEDLKYQSATGWDIFLYITKSVYMSIIWPARWGALIRVKLL